MTILAISTNRQLILSKDVRERHFLPNPRVTFLGMGDFVEFWSTSTFDREEKAWFEVLSYEEGGMSLHSLSTYARAVVDHLRIVQYISKDEAQEALQKHLQG